jgi:hypothetical protein
VRRLASPTRRVSNGYSLYEIRARRTEEPYQSSAKWLTAATTARPGVSLRSAIERRQREWPKTNILRPLRRVASRRLQGSLERVYRLKTMGNLTVPRSRSEDDPEDVDGLIE